MEHIQIIPWILFAVAVTFINWVAIRAIQQSRRDALRARDEAQAARDATIAQLQTELTQLKQPARTDHQEPIKALTHELAAMREHMALTSAELGKLHNHDREIRTLMSSLLARVSRLAEEDDGSAPVPLRIISTATEHKSEGVSFSKTDSLHLEFLQQQQQQLEEIRKKSQRLNLIQAATPANEAVRQTEEIFKAIRNSDLAGLRLAASLGGNINGVDYHNGYTPLHMAAREGNAELVGELLELGARIDSTDNFGKTPLRVAQEVAATAAVELLRHAEEEKTKA